MIIRGNYEYTPVYYIGESTQALRCYLHSVNVPREVIRYIAGMSDIKGIRDSILIMGQGSTAKMREIPELRFEVNYLRLYGRVTVMTEDDYRELVAYV